MDDEFVNRCERVIREEAESHLSDGRATLRRVESEVGPWFELMPASERACRLSVAPNGPGDGELSIAVGRRESWFERWGSADETVEFLRKALDAVIAGQEFIKGRKAIGRLELRDGPYLFSAEHDFRALASEARTLDARNVRALLTRHRSPVGWGLSIARAFWSVP